MSWKFWGRDEEPEVFIETVNIPMTTIARWYLYDMDAEDPEKVAAALNLNPISPEGAEKEAQDSVARMTRVLPFEEFVGIMADVNAQAITAIRNKALRGLTALSEDDEDLSEDELEILNELDEATYELFAQVSYTAILATLSIGFETGLFSPGTAYAHEVMKDE